jgi:hypothetical protein
MTVSKIVDLGSSPGAPAKLFHSYPAEGSPNWNGTGLENRRAHWPMRVRLPHPPPIFFEPVAQRNQSASLRSLRSHVRIVPGSSPLPSSADVAQMVGGAGLRNQTVMGSNPSVGIFYQLPVEGRWASQVSRLIFNQEMRGFKSHTPRQLSRVDRSSNGRALRCERRGVRVRVPSINPNLLRRVRQVRSASHLILNQAIIGSNPIRAANKNFLFGTVGQPEWPLDCRSREREFKSRQSRLLAP